MTNNHLWGWGRGEEGGVKNKKIEMHFRCFKSFNCFYCFNYWWKTKGLTEAILRDQYWQDCRTKKKLHKCSRVKSYFVFFFLQCLLFFRTTDNDLKVQHWPLV